MKRSTTTNPFERMPNDLWHGGPGFSIDDGQRSKRQRLQAGFADDFAMLDNVTVASSVDPTARSFPRDPGVKAGSSLAAAVAMSSDRRIRNVYASGVPPDMFKGNAEAITTRSGLDLIRETPEHVKDEGAARNRPGYTPGLAAYNLTHGLTGDEQRAIQVGLHAADTVYKVWSNGRPSTGQLSTGIVPNPDQAGTRTSDYQNPTQAPDPGGRATYTQVNVLNVSQANAAANEKILAPSQKIQDVPGAGARKFVSDLQTAIEENAKILQGDEAATGKVTDIIQVLRADDIAQMSKALSSDRQIVDPELFDKVRDSLQSGSTGDTVPDRIARLLKSNAGVRQMYLEAVRDLMMSPPNGSKKGSTSNVLRFNHILARLKDVADDLVDPDKNTRAPGSPLNWTDEHENVYRLLRDHPDKRNDEANAIFELPESEQRAALAQTLLEQFLYRDVEVPGRKQKAERGGLQDPVIGNEDRDQRGWVSSILAQLDSYKAHTNFTFPWPPVAEAAELRPDYVEEMLKFQREAWAEVDREDAAAEGAAVEGTRKDDGPVQTTQAGNTPTEADTGHVLKEAFTHAVLELGEKLKSPMVDIQAKAGFTAVDKTAGAQRARLLGEVRAEVAAGNSVLRKGANGPGLPGPWSSEAQILRRRRARFEDKLLSKRIAEFDPKNLPSTMPKGSATVGKILNTSAGKMVAGLAEGYAVGRFADMVVEAAGIGVKPHTTLQEIYDRTRPHNKTPTEGMRVIGALDPEPKKFGYSVGSSSAHPKTNQTRGSQ